MSTTRWYVRGAGRGNVGYLALLEKEEHWVGRAFATQFCLEDAVAWSLRLGPLHYVELV